jgi:hypothetical protein
MATMLRGTVKRVHSEELQRTAWKPVKEGDCEVSGAYPCASNGREVVSDEETAWGAIVFFSLFLYTSPSFDWLAVRAAGTCLKPLFRALASRIHHLEYQAPQRHTRVEG